MGQNSSSESRIFNVANGIENSITVPIIRSPSCIHVKVGDEQFIARIGTGTTHSICCARILETLKISMDNNKKRPIAAPNGRSYYPIIGESQLSIIIENAQVDHSFFVVEQLIEDFIIGMDVIEQFDDVAIRDHGKKIRFR